MAHPLLWPKKTFFYPIGNTPAVSLVQDLRPEEDAKILLLGCGDPRHILYTSYASGTDSTARPRILDFTCCDVEPAVLARNVLLLTMLADDSTFDNIPKIWNIFYHFYLDRSSLSLLLNQCKKLIKVSTSLDAWQSNPYAPFLRVCTTHTLSELHRHWTLYAQTEHLSEKEKKRLKDTFASGVKAKLAFNAGKVTTACRSAGPLWSEAANVVPKLFKRYWETGVMTLDAKEIAQASFVNPTFAYSMSGEPFPSHYGIDPVLSYHLAAAFAPINSPSTGRRELRKEDEIYTVVKGQFRQWCLSFNKSLRDMHITPKIIIRFFLGDALHFSRALQFCAASQSIFPGLYTAPWSAIELVLDGGDYSEDARSPAPLFFNVIDTSNLTDHVGLLNLLIVASPLLSAHASSTLYTEILLSSGEDATKGFTNLICADISAISLLLGLVPTGYAGGFTTHSNVHEILAYRSNTLTPQFHERIAWKNAYMGDTIKGQACPEHMQRASFDTKSLAKLLFGIYHKMFADEDKSGMLRNCSPETLKAANTIHYARRSFAALLRIVKDRIQTDWALLMTTLLNAIMADKKLLMGSNNYQDLCCQLHLLGVYSVELLLPNRTNPKFDKSIGRFRQWGVVPPVVCVALFIPRSKIKVLENIQADKIRTPIIHCEYRGEYSHAIFSSIHVTFGRVTSAGTKADPQIIVDVDHCGWSGTSGLVASFLIPSWMLITEPQKTRIGLSVRSTPDTFFLVQKLGLELSVFLASLLDEEHVFLARESPFLDGELRNNVVFHAQSSILTSNAHSVLASFNNSEEKVLSLTARVDIVEASARDIWSSGTPVTIQQVSLCTVTIICGDFKQIVAYPVPIDGDRSKLRIARKSFYVEVVVPPLMLATAYDHFDKFPVVLREKTPTLWNIHHLQLDRLPALDLSDPKKLDWITPHLAFMFSDREHALRKTNGISGGRGLLVDIKDTLQIILVMAAGVQGRKSRVFGLTESPQNHIYAFIFVTELRLDLPSHTIVADACILPLTDEVVANDNSRVFSNLKLGGLVEIKTVGEETKAWKRLLPAFIERCRVWKHKDSCEYIVEGVIPLSLEMGETPICSCGQGRGINSFRKVKEWVDVAHYVTRAAIGPLFAVSYLDSIAKDILSLKSRPVVPSQPEEVHATADCCAKCFGVGKPQLLKCSKCKNVSYCGLTCQREDWKRHKLECK